jgi:ribonuclease HI/ribosomal protein S27AE
MSLKIYTDGACEPNPGPGGIGVVLLDEKGDRRFSQGYRLTTNNRMELTAAIKGLEAAEGTKQVTLYSDSKYLVDAMTNQWVRKWEDSSWVRKGGQRVPNQDLWKKLLTLGEIHAITYVWVKGHAGDKYNEIADSLSYAAREQKDKIEDEGYLQQLALEEVSPSKITREGQPCRKCGTAVVKRIPKRKKTAGQAYYFEYYLQCPKCGTTYMVEEAKRTIDQGTLFAD